MIIAQTWPTQTWPTLRGSDCLGRRASLTARCPVCEQARGGTNFGSAAAVQTTAFAIGQTLGPALSLPLVAAFASGDEPAWLADGIAPASWPAAFLCLSLVPPLLLWVRSPTLNEHAPESMATSPLSIN